MCELVHNGWSSGLIVLDAFVAAMALALWFWLWLCVSCALVQVELHFQAFVNSLWRVGDEGGGAMLCSRLPGVGGR